MSPIKSRHVRSIRACEAQLSVTLDRDELLDELARAYAQAAVYRLLAEAGLQAEVIPALEELMEPHHRPPAPATA
jgi:hypothetical protein